MEIRFCEKCGRRVSEQDVERGGGLARGELVWCAGCAAEAPPAPAQPPAEEPRPSRPRVARGAPKPAAPRSQALVFAATVAFGMGAVLAVYFLFAGGKEKPRPLADAPAAASVEPPERPAAPEAAPGPTDLAASLPERPAEELSGTEDPIEAPPEAPSPEVATAAADPPPPPPEADDDFGPAYFAKTAFERAEAYSRERPGDVAGRFESYRPIARLYAATAPDIARKAEERLRQLAAALAEKGLVTNGGFEQGAAGWKIPKDGMGSVSTTQAATGRSSLRIVDADGVKGSNVCSDRFPVAVEGTYEIRGKAFPVSGSGVGVYVRMYDARGRQLNEKDARGNIKPVLGLGGSDREWKPFAGRFDAPPGTAKIDIWIHSYSTAKVEAYLDDLDIVAVQE